MEDSSEEYAAKRSSSYDRIYDLVPHIGQQPLHFSFHVARKW